MKIIGFISAGFLGVSGFINLYSIIDYQYMNVLWITFNAISGIGFITLAVFIGMLAHKLK